jgi:hypothetical protein
MLVAVIRVKIIGYILHFSKTTIDFGAEQIDKISVLTKKQKKIIEKLGFKSWVV